MDWTPERLTEPIDDPAAWERDAAAAVRRYLASPHTDVVVEDIRCEGAFPDTRLVVVAEGAVTKRRRNFVYDLWGPDFEIVPGGRESPEGVGSLVSVWVMEDLTT